MEHHHITCFFCLLLHRRRLRLFAMHSFPHFSSLRRRLPASLACYLRMKMMLERFRYTALVSKNTKVLQVEEKNKAMSWGSSAVNSSVTATVTATATAPPPPASFNSQKVISVLAL
ncbi:hypothetical protein ACLOJK_027506 [Asimina triloba]